HAIAEDTPAGGDDAARRLTPSGRRKMQAAVRGLRALGVEPAVILTSPLVRAVGAAPLGGNGGGHVPPTPRPARPCRRGRVHHGWGTGGPMRPGPGSWMRSPPTSCPPTR